MRNWRRYKRVIKFEDDEVEENIIGCCVCVGRDLFHTSLDRGWYTEMGGLTSGEADTAGRRKNKRIHRGALGMRSGGVDLFRDVSLSGSEVDKWAFDLTSG